MTNLQKLEANERREEQFLWAMGRCVVCGGWLRQGHPQLAHRVISSKHHRSTIPEEVLHHPLNTIPVDNSGACNSAVILHGPEADDLLDRVRRVLAGEEAVDMREEYDQLREHFYQIRVARSRALGGYE